MIQTKNWLINAICERHPAYGVEKGWSWYVGGMRDTGAWYFYKMHEASIKELEEFLTYLIEEENRPVIPLTEEELADCKIIYKSPNGFWMNEYQRKQMVKLQEEIDKKLWYGTDNNNI